MGLPNETQLLEDVRQLVQLTAQQVSLMRNHSQLHKYTGEARELVWVAAWWISLMRPSHTTTEENPENFSQ